MSFLLPETESNVVSEGQVIDLLNDRIRKLVEDLAWTKTKHNLDMSVVSNALHSEAETRRWCSEYETFIENVNNDLYVPLKQRDHTFSVRVGQLITLEVSRYIEVEAPSEEVAHERARELVEQGNSQESGRYTIFWSEDDVRSGLSNLVTDIRWGSPDEVAERLGEIEVSS